MVSDHFPPRARAIRSVAIVVLVTLVSALGATTAGASTAPPVDGGQVMAPVFTELTVDTLAAASIATPATATGSTGQVTGPTSLAGSFPANTDFDLRFDGTVDSATRTVLQAAAGVWSSVLAVKVPVTVDVTMQALGPGLLGSAGPTSAFYGRSSFPRQDLLYPVALANQFAGGDLDTSQSDIDVTLSSNFAWDKTLDGSSPGQSLLTVAIHEIGHGLGHTSWVRDEGSGLVAGFQVGDQTIALSYDSFVTTAAGVGLLSAVGDLLRGLVTSPLYWKGPKGVAANGGTRPKLYTPSSFEPGSSVGHLDEGTYPGELMTPDLHDTERIFGVSARAKGILADVGWTLDSGTTSPTSSTTSGNKAYVQAIAKDFLGRAATTGEIDQWSAYLASGGPRRAVAEAFAYSDAWVGVIVDGLYQSTLGRLPDAGGRKYWIDQIRGGATPAWVAAQFYASAEYFKRSGGTVRSWVGDLYREVLGREADASGLSYWSQRTASVGRTSVAGDFYQSVESRRTRVDALYRKLLGRGPDGGGLSYWVGVLANGRDVELATFLADSDEYFKRALQRFG